MDWVIGRPQVTAGGVYDLWMADGSTRQADCPWWGHACYGLRFIDCTHPLQNAVVSLERVQGWRLVRVDQPTGGGFFDAGSSDSNANVSELANRLTSSRDMTTRQTTASVSGCRPVRLWSCILRWLTKVKRRFGPSGSIPATRVQKNSGANGLSE